jgi:hypothetical protein
MKLSHQIQGNVQEVLDGNSFDVEICVKSERWHSLEGYQLGMLSGHHSPLHNLTRAALEHFWANQRLATPGSRRFQSRSPTFDIALYISRDGPGKGLLMAFGVDRNHLLAG